MPNHKLPILEEKGFVVLKKFDKPVPDSEFRHMEYVDWKSGGDTNFAPIASAFGDMECAGFWDHGKPDKDGIWTKNAEVCPTLVEWTERVGARYGRVRTIKLEPNTEQDAIKNLHPDDLLLDAKLLRLFDLVYTTGSVTRAAGCSTANQLRGGGGVTRFELQHPQRVKRLRLEAGRAASAEALLAGADLL